MVTTSAPHPPGQIFAAEVRILPGYCRDRHSRAHTLVQKQAPQKFGRADVEGKRPSRGNGKGFPTLASSVSRA